MGKKKKNGKGMSVSMRLSLNVLLFVSIIVIGMLFVVGLSTYRLIAEEACRSARFQLRSLIKDLETPLSDVETSTSVLAEFAALSRNDGKALEHLTQQMVARSSMVTGCAVAFADGVYRNEHWFSPYSYNDVKTGELKTIQLGNAEYDYFEMEWFKVPYESGKPHWSSPYFDEGGGGQRMVTYSFPLKDESGVVYAIVTADVPIKWIEDAVAKIHPYENSFTSILCEDGKMIGVDDTALISLMRAEVRKNIKMQEIVRMMKEGADSAVNFKDNNGDWTMAIFAPMRTGWSASLICRYEDVLYQTSRLYNFLFNIGLIGLLILFVCSYFAMRRLMKPIVKLTDAAMHISTGQFDAQLPEIKTHDEMMQLRDSFAYMQKSLTEYIEELKTTTAANNRMEGELSVASDIQMGMLRTDFPEDMFAKLVPAKEVGGDLYYYVQKDNKLYFAVGDVSGKGAPAALMMSITQAALYFVSSFDLSIEKMVERVNDSIAEANSANLFVTLFLGRIDLTTGEMDYCNAGHNSIIVLPPEGDAYYLKAIPNLALGLFKGFDYHGEHMTLQHGTRLVLYTDGVNEAEKADKSQFGDDRLLQWANTSVARDKSNSEQAVVENLYDTVRSFADGNLQNDDISIMSIKY